MKSLLKTSTLTVGADPVCLLAKYLTYDLIDFNETFRKLSLDFGLQVIKFVSIQDGRLS